MAYTHWEYFLALDADLDRAARFVEPAPANFGAYSIEFVRLLLAAGSEIDVVAKSLCNRISGGRPGNMDECRACITAHYPRFPELKVTVPRFSLVGQPWEEWSQGTSPPWWRAYNDVKHERDSYYAQGSLENCFGAVGGLFAILLYFYQAELYADQLLPWPRLLAVHSDYYRDARFVGTYTLPDFGPSH